MLSMLNKALHLGLLLLFFLDVKDIEKREAIARFPFCAAHKNG